MACSMYPPVNIELLLLCLGEKIKMKTENKSMLFAQCLFRPHFLDAPQHADKVEGLTPVEEKHR